MATLAHDSGVQGLPTGNPAPTSQIPPFTIEGEPGKETILLSSTYKPLAGQISLPSVVRHFLSLGPVRPVTRDQLSLILGRLRALKKTLDDYNTGLADPTDPWHAIYVKRCTLDQLSAFGVQIDNPSQPVLVPGLDELVSTAERMFADEIETARSVITGGKIVFEGLGELYLPGTAVCGSTGLAGAVAGFRVVESYYDTKRTLMGFERSFHLILEFIAAMGDHLAVVRFEEVLSGWQGVRARPLGDLAYVPMSASDHTLFEERGKNFAAYALGGPHFLQYSTGTFFAHGSSPAKRMSGTASSGSGRIIVDVSRGIQLGHQASQGMDEPSNAMMQLAGRYRRWVNDQKTRSSASGGQAPTSSDALFILTEIPKQLLAFTWPALVGFSFTAKSWGHVLVHGLGPIQFNDKAFDQLVLPPDHKRLIRALVTFGAEQFDDIIAGKSGGSIFLLHGPPGVGKTLTAEAISEVLQKPLYYVSMGELGTAPEEMEKRLGDVLDLCAGWQALVLMDEADVFLEKRATSDIVRNAMVCVMLRLLEYHNGILFLTTNRIREFDPAFESRVTLALRYSHLDPQAREQVWRNLVARARIDVEDVDFGLLAAEELNGRQIKNALRLAMALAKDAGTALKQDYLDQSIRITTISRQEMVKDVYDFANA